MFPSARLLLHLGNGLLLLIEKSTFFFYSCFEERETFLDICLFCNLASRCFTSQLKTHQLFSMNKRKRLFDAVCFLQSLSYSAIKEPPNGETCNFKTQVFLTEFSEQ